MITVILWDFQLWLLFSLGRDNICMIQTFGSRYERFVNALLKDPLVRIYVYVHEDV